MSFFAVNGLSSIVDYWGYGEWVFPPYQYLYWNIFEGKASSFGVDPWWKYFEKVVTRGIPPISLPLFIATLWFWAKMPWHILTAITLPFFVVHSMIGHKEIRFLFGIGLFSPLLFGLFLEKFQNLLEWKKTAKFIACLAVLLMIVSSVKVAYTPITFYKDLYQSGLTPKVIYTSDVVRDPMWFYMREPFEFELLQKPDFTQRMNTESGLYFSNDHELQEELHDKLSQKCDVIHQTYPQWVLDIKPRFIKMKYWGLYNCNSY